jgi:hypothetical protein
MRAKLLALLIAFSFFLSSCEIINPDEDIPSYVRVENISLVTDTTTQGSASHHITDAWLYVDNQLLGVYEMPVSIPVLAEGTHSIAIRGGVIVNGIASTRVDYPFYNFYNDTVNLTRGAITTVSPVVHYFSGTVFALEESFTGPGYDIVATAASDTNYYIVNDSNAFEGASCAAYLDASHSVFECEPTDSLVLPNSGPVYMEMNYKSNTDFSVALHAITAQQTYNISLVTIRATSEWKKIYINLATGIEVYPIALGYKPYIRMERNSTIGDAKLFFDNIKVVHF